MRYNRIIILRLIYVVLIYAVYYSVLKNVNIKISYIKSIEFLVLILFYYILDILNFKEKISLRKDIWMSCFINLCYFFVIFYINKKIKFMWVFLLYTTLQIILRWILIKLSKNKINILVIGEKEAKNKIKTIINQNISYQYVGYIDRSYSIEKDYLGKIKDIDKIIGEKIVDEIIFIRKMDLKGNLKKIMEIKLRGIKIIGYIKFSEEFQGKIDIRGIDELWVILNNGFISFNDNIQKRVKRIGDIFLGVFFIIVAFPLMIISSVIIKIESKGPIIYKQKRIGQNQKEFKLYKFRSMKNNAEKNGAKWAVKNDPRITKYGNFMRKSRIDELPQILNVLKGEMSFVGPRPERKIFINKIEKIVPYYNVRSIAKPGLTGWAQVMYPYGAMIEDSKNKLEYDLYYIRHQDIILDVMILFKTIKIVLFRKGR